MTALAFADAMLAIERAAEGKAGEAVLSEKRRIAATRPNQVILNIT